MTAPVIFLIAGEPSGDLLGAHLMTALRRIGPKDLRFAGVGGPRMEEAGIELFFPMRELTHFGLAEILAHIPHLMQRIYQTAAEIDRVRPAALVTIDAPDFCFRVARKLKGKGIPLIHYVAPTVWAWRAGRARKIAQFLDHLLALLPFEPPYFEREGLSCSFVGHPIVEGGADKGEAARFRAAHGLGGDTPVLAILLGSRRSEVRRLAPVFAAVVNMLKARHPNLVCVLPTVAHVEAEVRAAVAGWAAPVIVTMGDRAKYDGFKAATAALACSGTVALELALAGLPAVIAYRIHPVTAFLYRRLIKVRYANLVNIMHDRAVVPEFIQERCVPEKLAAALDLLLTDPSARAMQAAELKQTAVWLGADGDPPSLRAARAVLRKAGLTAS